MEQHGSPIENDHNSAEIRGTVAIPKRTLIENVHSSAALGQDRGDIGSAVPFDESVQSRGSDNGICLQVRNCSVTGFPTKTQVVAITTFNVLNFNLGHENDILVNLKTSSIIGQKGTGRRHKDLSQVRTVFTFTCVGFPTDANDRCSGVHLCVHKRMGKLRKVFEPTAQLEGRVGAV